MFWCAVFSLFLSTCTSQSNKSSSPLIGIDLGTTYSCVGILRDGKVDIIPNDQGNRITPSYVAFTATGERLIGDSAKNQVTLNPENTIFDVKRLVGRKFSDTTVQSDISKLPFKIINKNDRIYIQVADKLYTPEEISGMVLSKMKETAEKYLGEPVKDAIITVPAYFNDAQRQATKDAGTIAGLNVVRIINEPTAAAIAYGVDKKMKERNVLVYDLGGGTFDVTLLTIDDGVFEVLATNGDTHLGGEDFDHNVIDHFVKIIKKKQGLDIRSDPKAIQKLRREVEKAKRALSSQHQVTLEIEDLFQQNDFSEVLSRARFEALNNELFKKTLIPVQTVLDDAGLKASDVDEVILVGGSTRIPYIQTLVKDFFGGKEPARGVNPDEAVAVGASIQGGVLSGQASEILLLDVTPLSLGIETSGGVMSKLITKNTVIPTKRQSVFSTAADNQPGVDIRVFQGEREQVRFNKEIGNFHLSGIPPAPRGSPQIEVTFEIDANGILTVTANEKSSKNVKSLVIESTADRLSKEEIDAMVKDATDFAEEDRIFKDKTDAYNKFEAAAYQLSAQLKDETKLGGKLEAEDKKALETETASALDWLNTNKAASLEEINKRLSQFESVVHPITSKFTSSEPNPSSEEL